MLGFTELSLILVVTTIANLVVEVGAEVIAEWWVNGESATKELANWMYNGMGTLDAQTCVADYGDMISPVAQAWALGQAGLYQTALEIQLICDGMAI